MSKIKKILIANRGEIACRVIKTARKMGIKTVAVYSDADAKALHVRMADEAVHIGPSPAAESYLVIDKIIEACKQTGADAVHPGYGFLSENPAFARALKKAKITFIGPAPESMEAMGLKDAAKALMTKAGVPVTPGYQGDNQDPKHLAKEAGKIGYPVLIKAVAGGGGKGMRKVEMADDFEDMLASCQREAKSSFGNDIVLIEKYITSPRHIEVQVFGDTHGNVVHMFERDCSLQRRHQKVIEEAPAPGMTDKVRKAMTTAAVNAAKAVDYVGAGTVEFIVDGSGKLKEDGFWFMEMNTRLQVEHPVTEMITGLDLVELQIRVAQGEKLPKQEDIEMEGHAIEARLYAEDPANDFLPSIGKLERFSRALGETRVDTGVEEGDAISIFYDPMIAKLIHHDVDRKTAIYELRDSLSSQIVWPVRNNCQYLYDVLGWSEFLEGKMSTTTLPQTHNIWTQKQDKDRQLKYRAAIWKIINVETDFFHDDHFHEKATNNTIGREYPRKIAFRLNQPNHFSQTYFAENEQIDFTVFQKKFDWQVEVFDQRIAMNTMVDDEYFPATWLKLDSGYLVTINGNTSLYSKHPPEQNLASNANALTAPMPGKIISVGTKAGDTVKAGDKLIVMEAMKMEMSLEAPRDGVVAAVNVSADQLVNDGDILLELEKEE